MNPPSSCSSSSSSNSVHLVLQRYRSCKLLLNETEWVTQGPVQHGVPELVDDIAARSHSVDSNSKKSLDSDSQHCGLLIYISFAKNTTSKSCWDAAETCCNVPLLTNGMWGDTTSELCSLKQILTTTIATTTTKNNDVTDDDCDISPTRLPHTSVTIVPQANLICSMKRHGTSIQYHNQISKEDGQYYYELFVHYIRANIYEYHYHRTTTTTTNQEIPSAFLEWKLQYIPAETRETNSSTTLEYTKLDPSIPPQDIFRNATTSLYGSYDTTTGLPITDIHNVPLTKSALKKLRKMQDVHRSKHEKWLQQPQASSSLTASISSQTEGKTNSGTNDKVDLLSTATHTVPTTMAVTTTTPLVPNQEEALSSTLPPLLPPPVPTEMTFSHDNHHVVVIVAGTFGKRQGIEIISDMGPFCHTVQI